MTLKKLICQLLDSGHTLESAWREAERVKWHAPWNYVRKIARDWEQEQLNQRDIERTK